MIPIFKKFPAAEWVRVAAEAGIAMQPVRAPEDSHADPALVKQGSIVEVEDPELGTLRQSGLVYRMHKTPGKVRGGAARRGEHTDAVKAEADAAAVPSAVADGGKQMKGPLDGIKVLDLGVAVAGPWCGELLAQLGATLIKVDPPRQNFWLATKMAKAVNRSKRHLALDIKTARRRGDDRRAGEAGRRVHHQHAHAGGVEARARLRHVVAAQPGSRLLPHRGLRRLPRPVSPATTR